MEKKKIEVREVYMYLVTWMTLNKDVGLKATTIQRSMVPMTEKIDSAKRLIAFEKDFSKTQNVGDIVVIAFSYINKSTQIFMDGHQLKQEDDEDAT